MKKPLLLLALLAAFICASSFTQKPKQQKKPNIILLIGDGMGITQLSTAFYYKEDPNVARFPVVGLSRTSSSKEKITDSAAGATALACGKKTYNGAIAVNEQGDSLATLVELLSLRGYQTGLVATSSITHATPACFYAHVPSREMEEEIAAQLMQSEVDFFAGGGRTFFTDRKDKRNLLQQERFVIETEKLGATDLAAGKRYGFLLAEDGMPKVQDGRKNFLKDATQLALKYFRQQEKPFFLMVEASQIDWGGHANDGEYIVEEMLDFDAAIGAAVDFSDADKNTLVVVTADHETGGFTLAAERKKIPFQGMQSNYADIRFDFSTMGHSAAMVPVLSKGVGERQFSGIYQNTGIFHRIMALAGPQP